MIISGIEAGIPQKSVQNIDIIDLVKYYSDEMGFDLEHKISSFFSRVGANHRFWRKSSSEPFEMLIHTSDRLFERFDKNNIDVVISCGVTKYFAEPAHASIFCDKTGLRPKIAFDVSDGCMGWLTALSLLKNMSNEYSGRLGLIISHEFPMGKNGAVYPKVFTIQNPRQLKYKLPALTIGEATTLTVVKISTSSDLVVRKELPEGAAFCTMPFRNFVEFSDHSDFVDIPEMFHAHYTEMSRIGARSSLKMIRDFVSERSIFLFPHGYTHSFEKLAKFLAFDVKIINHFSEYGNLATSSIPLNLLVAHRNGTFSPHQPTYVWCASAGIKTSIMKITLAPDFS